MKGLSLPAAVLLAATLLAGGVAHGQARGPAAEEILEHGQVLVSGREQRETATRQAMATAVETAREEARKEQEELRDPAVRARQLAELDTWFRRIPGRFRIDGLVKKGECRMGACADVSGKVTGIADCTGIGDGVGDGVGVQCILSATWPTIELEVASFMSRMPPPPSEMLRTISPAVLVLGLNLDPPGIRAHMVDAESLAHTWVGKLTQSTARASRVNAVLAGRNVQPLQIIAEPDSEVVTIILRSSSITLTLTMHRDPEARAEKPIKTLKSR